LCCVVVLVGLVYVSGGVFELKLVYVKGFDDPKCLGVEALNIGRFRVGEKEEKSQVFGEKGWGVALASTPQEGL